MRTKPFKHQEVEYNEHTEDKKRAIFWEMGTGKSKLIMDEICALFGKGLINGALIVAPKGAYLSWVMSEIPKHLWVEVKARVAVWSSEARKEDKAKLETVTEPEKGILDIVIMNTESIATARGYEYAERFMTAHEAFMCVDESTSIKNIKAKRTKGLIKLGRLASYKRIMSGSPVTQSPLDLYSQMYFLDPAILDFPSYVAFRNYFGKFINIRVGLSIFPKIVGYRNLDVLKERIQPYSTRVLKSECLDLPDKIYQTRYIEMSPEQALKYRMMKTLCIAELKGKTLSVTHALTVLVKLHQIACGHIKDEEGNVHYIDNSRLNALTEVLDETDGKVIIWCTFVYDVYQIEKLLKETYGDSSVVTYHGDTLQVDREVAIWRMQNDKDCRFFVGTSQTGGRGITLTEASTVIYFSNSFNLETRLQSEDRAHRIGQAKNVTYIDIVTKDTIDEKVMKALRDKKNLATEVIDTWQTLLKDGK